MINKLRRLLLYGGLEKKQFLSISKEIYAENQTILYYSLIASIILLTLLAVFAVFLNPVNVITYIIADLLMAGLFAAYRFWEPLRKKWTNPMVCVFKYILYFLAQISHKFMTN